MLSNRLVKPETYIQRADKAMAAEDWPAAVKSLLKVIKKLKTHAPPSTFVKLVRSYRKLNSYDKALSTVKQGLGVHPDSQSLFIEKAEIAMEQQDWQLAVKRWQAVKQKAAAEVPLAVNIRLGRALRLNGNLDEAKALIDEQLQHQPNNLDLLVESTEILTAQKNWSKALAKWQTILQNLDSSHQGLRVYIRLNISLISRLLNLKKYREKIEAYQVSKNKGHRKIAIVTAYSKGYDVLKPHHYIDDNYDYFVFTDDTVDGYGIYNVKSLPINNLDDPRNIRYVKTHPHSLFRAYELVVWVDTSVMIVDDLNKMLTAFIKSKKPIAASLHPLRKNIDEEFTACVKANKEKAAIMKKQVSYYKKLGYGDLRLAECTVLAFNLKDKAPEVERAMETWWQQINRFSRRDQLSFPFALASNKIEWYPLTKPPEGIRDHPALVLTAHNQPNPTLNELIYNLGKQTS